MSILDTILGAAGSQFDVANLASKVGIDPQTAEKAIAALGVAHAEPGDTVEGAAAKTGIDPGILSQIVGHIGGDGSLGSFAQMIKDSPQATSMLSMLDRDGDGNPVNDVLGMAKGLFGSS
jgi:hypothetical protein